MGGRQKAECGRQKRLLALLCTALASVAATNSEISDDLLKLQPPHAELPPTFWEQYGVLVVVAAVLFITFVGLLVWVLLRPKPAVIVPIEVRTRQELEALRARSEDGVVLSQVSRAVRRYFVAAFELSAGEMTTADFCAAVKGNEKFSPELAAAVTEFLRRCDELKFAPGAASSPIGAAARGLELLNLGEARRALLRQAAAVTSAKVAGQGA